MSKKKNPVSSYLQRIESEMTALLAENPEAKTDPHLKDAVERLKSLHTEYQESLKTRDENNLLHYGKLEFLQLDDVVDKLIAMRFLNENLDRAEDIFITSPSTEDQLFDRLHQMSLWFWMKNDQARLASGEALQAPYRCRVLQLHHYPNPNEHQVASDFWSLCQFVPGYCRKTNKILIPIEYKGNSDFLCYEKGSGKKTGLRVATARNENQSKQREALSKLLDVLHKRLAGTKAFITIHTEEKLNWQEIFNENRVEILIAAIQKNLRHDSRQDDTRSSEWPLIDIPSVGEILLSMGKNDNLIIWTSDRYGWVGNEPENLEAESIIECIKRSYELIPENSPQSRILAVYPNNGLPVFDHTHVVREVQRKLGSEMVKMQSLQEIWMIKGEQRALRIYPMNHLQSIKMTNVACFEQLEWPEISAINVIIGPNDTGKTHLLKMLYAGIKSIEVFTNKRNHSPSLKEEISQKLYWLTEQPLCNLVTKTKDRLSVAYQIADQELEFSIEKNSDKEVASSTENFPFLLGTKAVYIPPKEVFGMLDPILQTRLAYRLGFDDTYHDLANLLRTGFPPDDKNLPASMRSILEKIENDILKGVFYKEPDRDLYTFKNQDHEFTMGQTAEGFRKLGVLTTLIRQGSIASGSVLFIDEPENNLHPVALRKLIEILFELGLSGVQIFVATHSWFVLKQFEILARFQSKSVTLCSLSKDENGVKAEFSDLKDNMPENPIIDETIAMYDDEARRELEARQ